MHVLRIDVASLLYLALQNCVLADDFEEERKKMGRIAIPNIAD
jgi:hypothetical protein